MSKVTFWQRLFGGKEANTETPSVQTDATGQVSFTADQFTTLTAHMEATEGKLTEMSDALDKAAQSVEAANTKMAELEGKVANHQARLDKAAQLPATPVAATSVEPKTAAGDAGTESVDPLDAELKALQK